MKKMFASLALISFMLVTVGCQQNKSESSIEESSSQEPISSSVEESSSEPQMIDDVLYTASGLKVSFKAQGARIDKIEWNNKQIAKDGFTVGRVANRIANGKFTLNDTEYSVKVNDRPHSLHGGGNSWQGPFATANWTKVQQTFSSITYSLTSKDKDNGYPGNLYVTVQYTLSEEGELSINYLATSDADTLFNPTNHLYMSLNSSNNYNNVNLWIDADNYTPLANKIPTGEIAPVSGTQFDYATEKAFDGSKNYDDNYVLKATTAPDNYRKVATMTGVSSGIKVDVFTDRIGLQLYKAGNGDICLETQQFPDMINQPTFASYGTTVLKAGETFNSKTTYHFSKVSA